MFIETQPQPSSVRIPPSITPQWEREGRKGTIGCGKLPVQPVWGDYTFKSEFKSTWYMSKDLQPFKVFLLPIDIEIWSFFNMFFQEVSQISLKVNLAKKLHCKHPLVFWTGPTIIFLTTDLEFVFFAQMFGQEVVTFQQQQRLCSNFANFIFVVHFHRFCRSAAATWYLFMKFTSW